MSKEINVTHNMTVIEPSHGWFNLQLKAIWVYRELLYFLIWRDIKVRYKQTVLGLAWVIIQPMLSMAIFSGLFGSLLNAPTGGIPYPLFTLSGLVVWQYFSGSLNRSSTSLVDNSNLITKIYFPRLIIPISAVLSGLLDFFVSLFVLAIFLFAYRVPLTYHVTLLPLFLFLSIITALGFGLWLTALNVRYRDIKHILPFLVQIWMYLTPVVYSIDLIPENLRWCFGLNPMTSVVLGFRWILLGNLSKQNFTFDWLFFISITINFLVFISGLIYFRRTERTFADVI